MALHTVPMVCAAINFIFLMDAPIYASDVWVLFAITITYAIANYTYYHLTGRILYKILDWSDPDQYTNIVLTIIGLFILAVISNSLIAVIS